MNQILIWEPRWHDKTVLVADYRLFEHNEIRIGHKDFPTPLYLSGKEAKEYPLEKMKTKNGGTVSVRVIPLAELQKEVLDPVGGRDDR